MSTGPFSKGCVLLPCQHCLGLVGGIDLQYLMASGCNWLSDIDMTNAVLCLIRALHPDSFLLDIFLL